VSNGPPSSTNPYENPELFRFVGSMEGVPEWVDPAETPAERAALAGWRGRGHGLLEMAGQLMPGLALALLLALFGRSASGWIGTTLLGLSSSPVSPILVAILVGLLIRNTIGLPAVYELGLQLCLKRILRVGVALLGIRLSLASVGAIGLSAVPVILLCIAAALLLVDWAARAFGLPRRLGVLIAVGSAICGNTAIVAMGPVIGADEDEISYAVGTITVFGLLALATYPFVAHGLFGDDVARVGLFLGTAIHDTAQVAGAGLLYAQQYAAPAALDTATVTKLVRNLFMIGVIPLVAILHHREGASPSTPRPRVRELVPFFVFGFVGMAALRTLGDLGEAPFGGWLSADTWTAVIDFTGSLSAWCLTVAMASVGLGTHLKRLRRLGLRPLGVGFVAALVVGAVSAAWLTWGPALGLATPAPGL
jgi:uncharacterized integral membrane protein (TIGR00698 family)